MSNRFTISLLYTRSCMWLNLIYSAHTHTHTHTTSTLYSRSFMKIHLICVSCVLYRRFGKKLGAVPNIWKAMRKRSSNTNLQELSNCSVHPDDLIIWTFFDWKKEILLHHTITRKYAFHFYYNKIKNWNLTFFRRRNVLNPGQFDTCKINVSPWKFVLFDKSYNNS